MVRVGVCTRGRGQQGFRARLASVLFPDTEPCGDGGLWMRTFQKKKKEKQSAVRGAETRRAVAEDMDRFHRIGLTLQVELVCVPPPPPCSL